MLQKLGAQLEQRLLPRSTVIFAGLITANLCLGLWLMTLAIAVSMGRSLAMDFSALFLGLLGVVFVLTGFARGR